VDDEALLEQGALVRAFVHHVAVQVHLQERGGRNLIKPQTKGVDEEVRAIWQRLAPGRLHRDVVEHELVPLVVGREPVGDGELAAGLPLLLAVALPGALGLGRPGR